MRRALRQWRVTFRVSCETPLRLAECENARLGFMNEDEEQDPPPAALAIRLAAELGDDDRIDVTEDDG